MCCSYSRFLFLFIGLYVLNVKMHMYNLKTKPQVFRNVFWRVFCVFFSGDEEGEKM